MSSLTLTDDEIYKFRVCFNLSYRNGLPAFCLDREVYNNYYLRKFARLTPFDNVMVRDEHNDVYIHNVQSIEAAHKIIEEGFLSLDYANEDCSFGRAVYTYPLGGGRYFSSNQYAIIFSTHQEHYHVVDDLDSNTTVGEAIFLKDVKLINPKIVKPCDVIDTVSENFDFKRALVDYYGFSSNELEYVVDKYGDFDIDRLPHVVNDVLYGITHTEELTKCDVFS